MGRMFTLSGNEEVEEGVGVREELMVGGEGEGHGGIGREGVAEGSVVGREEVEEGEERKWGKRERVEGDEVDDVAGGEGREEALEGGGGGEGLGLGCGGDDGFGDFNEDVVIVVVAFIVGMLWSLLWLWWGVP